MLTGALCRSSCCLLLRLFLYTHSAGQVALILGERALLAGLRRRGVALPELVRIGLTLVSTRGGWCCTPLLLLLLLSPLERAAATGPSLLTCLCPLWCFCVPVRGLQAVLLGTGHWLFFLPAEAAGVPALFAASMRQSFAAMASASARLLLTAVGRV